MNYLPINLWDKILGQVSLLDLLNTRHVSQTMRQLTIMRFHVVVFNARDVLRELMTQPRYAGRGMTGKGYREVLGNLLETHGKAIKTIDVVNLGFSLEELDLDWLFNLVVKHCKNTLSGLRVYPGYFITNCKSLSLLKFGQLKILGGLQDFDGVLDITKSTENGHSIVQRLNSMDQVGTLMLGRSEVEMLVDLSKKGALSGLPSVKNIHVCETKVVGFGEFVKLFPNLEGVLVNLNSNMPFSGILPKSLKRLFLVSYSLDLKSNFTNSLSMLTNLTELGLICFFSGLCENFQFLSSFQNLEAIELRTFFEFSVDNFKLIPTNAPLKRVQLEECIGLDCCEFLSVLMERKYNLTEIILGGILQSADNAGICTVELIEKLLLRCANTLERIEVTISKGRHDNFLNNLSDKSIARLKRIMFQNLCVTPAAAASFVERRRQLFQSSTRCGLLALDVKRFNFKISKDRALAAGIEFSDVADEIKQDIIRTPASAWLENMAKVLSA